LRAFIMFFIRGSSVFVLNIYTICTFFDLSTMLILALGYKHYSKI
jgi:hypothetical protein